VIIMKRIQVAIAIVALYAGARLGAQTAPPASHVASEIVVAQDGSGQFRTIQAALDSIPKDNAAWKFILLRNGVYNEKVYINAGHVILVGEDRDRTRIVYAELRKNWRKDHPNDWGAAVVNIGDEVTDVALANLTVYNNYGVLFGDSDHQFAIRGGSASSRISLLHTAIIADGGDTLSLWNADTGMYYHNDSYFEGFVDFVCPRGKNYISNSTFYAHHSSAAIWHDGSKDKSHKFVIRHSWFDGVPGFPLGRNHRDGQFFLLDDEFSSNMADKPIYPSPAPQPLQWGQRYYYWNDHRDGGDFAWFANNLDKAEGAPKAGAIDAKWTFGGAWDPENSLPPILPFASIPRPEHTAVAVERKDLALRWMPARGAVRQRVYFGTSTTPPLAKELSANDFKLRKLDPGTTYYWRVDTVTSAGVVVSGQQWSFTTAGAPTAHSPTAKSVAPADRKPRIVIVGDSTVTDEIGWGRGFKARVSANAETINRAKNGRSSRSYLAEGLWKKALEEKPDYILIQFGHNDMPGKGPARETDPHGAYLEFMSRYIHEARAAGAVPVIVTSISRRNFGKDGQLKPDLWEYAQAARQLAVEEHAPLIDLHELSVDLLRRMGPAAVEKFGPKKPDGSLDNTHLNEEASKLFGGMVAEELGKVVPALAGYMQP
jgi:pectinesterase